MVADSARYPVYLQSRRRDRQPEPSNAEDQERTGDRFANQHHVLRRLGGQAEDVTQSGTDAIGVQRAADGAARGERAGALRGAGARRRSATTTKAAPAAATQADGRNAMSGSMFAPNTSQKGMWRTIAYQPASTSAVSGGEMTAAASAATRGSAPRFTKTRNSIRIAKKPVIITGSETSALAWIMKCRSAMSASA